jgi:hypothetical protein
MSWGRKIPPVIIGVEDPLGVVDLNEVELTTTTGA